MFWVRREIRGTIATHRDADQPRPEDKNDWPPRLALATSLVLAVSSAAEVRS